MPIAQDRLQVLQVCKLLQYVREEDKVGIEKMVVNGMPHIVNYNEPVEGNTALMTAACANNENMVEYLLNLGAHPDVMDFQGRSAIMRVAEYGHVECMELIAKAGADMRQEDLQGKSVLFYCISSTDRHSKCLAIALQYGADVNNKTKDGRPVLLVANETAAENEEICLLLLKARADPKSKHEASGKTALMAACGSGSLRVVRDMLERGADVNVLDKRNRHAAHYAATGGFLEVLFALAAYGALFDQQDDRGNSPIHLAANGHAMCCKFLAQRGCNPKPKNDDGFVAKIIAKDNGHKDCMKELRKVERSFGKVGKNNEPASLTLYDWVNERQQLIRDMFQQFDPEATGSIAKDVFEESMRNIDAPVDDELFKKIIPLHDKTKTGNINIEEFISGKKYINKLYLLSAFEGKKKKKKKGRGGKKAKKFRLVMPICTMDEGPRAPDGGPPAMYIEQHLPFTDQGRYDRDHPPQHPMQDDSAWYLNNPAKVHVNINDAAKYADIDSMKQALAKGTSVDTRDKYYKTPLMAACASGNLNAVKFLLLNGAAVNARDNFKWTPLHHACHAGQLDIAQLLLENGAELDAVALNGGTPLQRAIESSRLDLVQFLIEKGAKILTENRKGQNPMDIALSYADPRVIDAVANKWESMPKPSDKKGKKGGKKPPPKKRATPTDKTSALPTLRAVTPDETPRVRRGSILRAASALAGGIDEREDITYCPRRAWTEQPTTEDLIAQKVVDRERFTYEVDFPDFEMPFQKNVTNKIIALGPAAME